MYADHPPPQSPSACPRQVLVLQPSDLPYNPDTVIEEAEMAGAVSDDDGVIYWIVFEEEPRRLWDFTRESLVHSLNQKNLEVHSKGN